MLAGLVAVACYLVVLLVVIGDRVVDPELRPIPTVVETPTTTTPQPATVCVVGGDNWAARFGVEDRTCT